MVVIKPENNSLFPFLQSTLWGQIPFPGKQEGDKIECQSILEKNKKHFWGLKSITSLYHSNPAAPTMKSYLTHQRVQ